MKRIFWDVLVDSNNFRVFRTNISSRTELHLLDNLKSNISLLDDWKVIPVNITDEEEDENKKPIADFVAIDLAFEAISEKTQLVLAPLINKQVEFLPFETPMGVYYGLHVRYVDCLDAEHSEVFRFKNSGRIMEVENYAFHWERLDQIHIFRLAELGLSRLFVSDEFRHVVEKNGLTGLEFYPVPLVDGEE